MKGLLQAAGVGLASFVVALALSELVVRWTYGDKFGPRPDFLIPDAGLGWRPAADLDDRYFGPDFSMEVVTDDNGYRLGRLGPTQPSDELVALLGDSYTFGWGVDSDETFAATLDSKLASSGHPRRRVVNLGVNGYGTLHYGIRLRELLGRPVKWVVVMHSHNDQLDNVVFVLRKAGFYEPQPRPEAERSRSQVHILNVLSYWRWARSHRHETARAPLKPQDALFSAPMRRTHKKSGLVYTGSVAYAYSDVDPRDFDYQAKRTGLSPLQRELIERGIREIHCALPGVRILHTAIHSAPTWFTETLRRTIAASEGCGAKPEWMGKIPLDTSAFEIVLNPHSGGHYTPEVNRRYADVIYQWIEEPPVAAGQ